MGVADIMHQQANRNYRDRIDSFEYAKNNVKM